MGNFVELRSRGSIALIALNNPPVNALNFALRQGISDAFGKAVSDKSVKAIVLAGKGRCFCGGADIREFGKPRKGPHLSTVIDTIEACEKPVVAAIHGTAVGGGCEIALGCHYRIGDASARFGQPEIKLGLLPGAGGTQRLPRLIGLEPALEIILSGAYVDAERGQALGFFDAIVEGDLTREALLFAERLLAAGKGPRPVRDLQIDKNNAEKIFAAARANASKRARGLIAPERCIEAVESTLRITVDDGLALERKFFAELVQSDQSKAQRHLFFAERQAQKIPGVPADTATRAVRKVAVIGCGTMGRGIAMNLANGGVPVTVLDMSREALDAGLSGIRDTYAGSVSRGSLSQSDIDERIARISGATDYADIANADMVIEAVFEEMDLKKRVFAALDQVCKPGAILATNTSTLDVNEIASATARPGDVIGTHFFSPANVMKLVEIVRGKKTSPQVIATVLKLTEDIGKIGALVGVCDGFVGNRMLYAYTRQANFLLEEGALPQQIDRAIHDFGLPMGPFAMGDLAGLDVGYRVRRHRRAARPSNDRTSPLADRIVEMGRLGQKTGAGWYRYEKGSRTPIPDPQIEQLIIAVSKELGIERRTFSDRDILERCLYPLINEGAKILADGIALRPGDIDVIWIYGFGFPRGRGGPMYTADLIGLDTICKAMSKYHEQHGDILRPAPLLQELAASGKKFADFAS